MFSKVYLQSAPKNKHSSNKLTDPYFNKYKDNTQSIKSKIKLCLFYNTPLYDWKGFF